ncbi:RNA 2'-phosphotransferase [Thermostaphylospora chromogena]|uniref:Probable RNA 2'-phosphotransferase n=1 Tax=Thermostaphylospora chromogena TaxID=35622 RepID=A0A1H1A3Z2_9ACTN|nr:RNA 2'-phosphotransferase [Thermostaphylospora chromogena]SDQ34036.1 putative RNA 2'-phosphotransferase [Thermostaphylospora chromogena]
MDERRMVRISKYLAKHLRHQPERIGITLDEGGWVDVDVLLAAAARHGFPISEDELVQVVTANDKRRYTLENGRIRADQGHSVPVELGLPAITPPPVLYHGTVGRNLAAIRAEGLRPMGRNHVHLSSDRETAARVGARRGVPVVLVVDAAAMHAAGHEFRRSVNGVWLTSAVPPGFLRFPKR